MSADNYLYVRKTADGHYAVHHLSASADYESESDFGKPLEVLATADAAIKFAFALDRKDYFEYGVDLSEEVAAEWTTA